MKTMDCGCEKSPGGKLVSVCAMHAEYGAAMQGAAKHPRAGQPDNHELRDKLLLVIAPEVVRRAVPGERMPDIAQCVADTVHEILRRHG
jgi:hypothetical protein